MSRLLHPFKLFFNALKSGGFLLMLVAVVSLYFSNGSEGQDYIHSFHHTLDLSFANLQLNLSFHQWINDALMAVFFLLVGLEIKRELVTGELSQLRKALLPVIAAAGGMIVPALLYAIFNNGTETAQGWGIPMATDIAFALAVLSLAGNNVPVGLKIFLTALAIIDDLGAILVIAVFYTRDLATDYLLFAFIPVALLAALNYFNVRNLLLYILVGLVLWYCVFMSGIHATIAGVLLALFIPLKQRKQEQKTPPLEYLEQLLHTPVNFLVLPLFALANTALAINPDVASSLSHPVMLGVMVGLCLGKPIGITLFSWIAIRFNLASIPQGTNWNQLFAAGILGGIGFTMSIFISMLAFTQPEYQDLARIAILISSTVAGVVGYAMMKMAVAK